jgi:hypothetical protein
VGGGLLQAAIQPVPRLDSASLTFLQRGTTNTVTLSGDGLAAVTDHLASHKALRLADVPSSTPAVVLEGSLGGITVRPTDPAKTLALQVIIAPDAPLGAHELRVAGPGGVSNPLTVQVTDLHEILEPAGTSDVKILESYKDCKEFYFDLAKDICPEFYKQLQKYLEIWTI